MVSILSLLKIGEQYFSDFLVKKSFTESPQCLPFSRSSHEREAKREGGKSPFENATRKILCCHAGEEKEITDKTCGKTC